MNNIFQYLVVVDTKDTDNDEIDCDSCYKDSEGVEKYSKCKEFESINKVGPANATRVVQRSS